MINHFKTKIKIELNMEEEYNLMIMKWNIANVVQPLNYRKINYLNGKVWKYRKLTMLRYFD
jgi:hypothetical protein